MNKPSNQSKADSAREVALDIIYDVFENGAYSNLSLDKHLKHSQLLQNDKNFVTETVNGSIRMVKHLDWVLALFLKKPVQKQNPWVRNLLRMSVYQLIFMDRVPDYAIVNSAVELSRKKGAKGLSPLVNGVLRKINKEYNQLSLPSSTKSEYLAVKYSQQEWLVNVLLEQWGEDESLIMLDYWNKPAPVTIRPNLLVTSRDELRERLNQEGAQVAESAFTPWALVIEKMPTSIISLPSYREGFFYIQNETAMLAASILNPQSGEALLDLCCGVGGKTTHFAEYMGALGEITAYDLYEHKIKLLNENIKRLGINNVNGWAQDILGLDQNLKVRYVFLDAPCSGWGVLNRRSDSRWNQTEESMDELLILQRKLLHKAALMVENDGHMVYSTCTLNKQENENQISAFLKENEDFYLEGFADEISAVNLDQNDRSDAFNGMLTITPGKYQTDGMFFAKMKKKKDRKDEYRE